MTSEATPPAYRITGLKALRGGKIVLDLRELCIPAGGAVALTGSNGAGKTTLLKLLALLEPPEEGSLSFFGQVFDPRRRPTTQDRRRVTLVGQAPYVFSGSVLSNAAFGLRARGVGRAEAKARALAALEELGLGPFATRVARTLSGGETSRLAVARALALGPEVLLLDEPTADVDEANRGLIEEAVSRANREKGMTVVFSSHDKDQAPRLSAAVFRLVAGKLAEGETGVT